jgi:type IV secretory pathway VirJ component
MQQCRQVTKEPASLPPARYNRLLGRARGALGALRAAACAVLLCQCSCVEVHPQRLTWGRFHDVRIYQPPDSVQQVALLLSGDGGWTSALGEIAQGLTGTGTLLAGIDVRDLLAGYRRDTAGCVSPGADLAQLLGYLRQRYRIGRAAAVLIGHSAGATLAYVALAQSAPGTFAGALTLSFCVDLDLAKPSLCPASALRYRPRSGGVRLLPAPALPSPWVALHGLDDAVCPASEARAFVADTPGAQFVPLPGVTHDYRHSQRWWARFAAAYARLAVTRAPPEK